MNIENISETIAAAKGEKKADLVLKNARITDLFRHRTLECDIAVHRGKIAGLGKYSGVQEEDLKGAYVLPSFTDAHVHIESSMLTPAEYARAVVPKGVTALIADPHEIVNVCGEEGLAYMTESAKGLPLDIHYMLPSCVPATPFDSSGCVLDGDATLKLFDKFHCFGLGEMMNFPGLLAGDGDVLKKLCCCELIDGHAPGLSGRELCAYIAGGVLTDHECISPKEVLEKVSLGMYVLIREGSGAKNLEDLIPAITPYTLRRLLFCTDDKHLDDICEQGGVSHCVNKAIALGVDPIDAITMASLNCCECYGLKKRGAIAPGFNADLLVCESLSAEKVLRVYKDGKLVAADGEPLFEVRRADTGRVTHTLNYKPLRLSDLELDFKPSRTVIEVHPHSLYTTGTHCDTAEGLNIAAVIERHRASGNIGKAYVKGIGIEGGAVASSIGHDSHNITTVGDSAASMLRAVEALGTEGGISVVRGEEVRAVFKLPVAGLMTDSRAMDALDEYSKVLKALREICRDGDGSLLMLMSFMSLLVIPELKLSDKGLFDVSKQCFIGE